MSGNVITLETSCHCGRPATHMVSDGAVTLRTCYLHVRKAALTLKQRSTR